MESKILECIKDNKLIKPGEFIGVAVSGGADSMALLNFLNDYKEDLDCEIVAITVDHMLRGENSLGDAMFVKNFCNERHIPCWKFSVDAERVAENEKVGVEEGARIARYGIFDKMLNENKVDKNNYIWIQPPRHEGSIQVVCRGMTNKGLVITPYDRNRAGFKHIEKYKDELESITKKHYKEFADSFKEANRFFEESKGRVSDKPLNSSVEMPYLIVPYLPDESRFHSENGGAGYGVCRRSTCDILYSGLSERMPYLVAGTPVDVLHTAFRQMECLQKSVIRKHGQDICECVPHS